MAAGAVNTVHNADPHAVAAGFGMGAIPFWFTNSIATTDFDHVDDSMILSPAFPDVAYILNAPGSLTVRVTQMDAGAGLDIDFGFGGSDGVLDFTMINSAGAGQSAANYTNAAIATKDVWLDIGGLYLLGEVIATVAGAASAGTIEVGGWYTQQVKEIV